MSSNGLRNAPEHQFLQSPSSMRSKYNQIGTPLGSGLKDSRSRLGFNHAGSDSIEAGRMEHLNRSG